MKLLEESELIYGRMMRVHEAHMIERYNQALSGFNLKPTKLTSFRIDMTGFSPEVAQEQGDRQYLDPGGINRRFIILSPEQQFLPVVHTAFSNTGQLMHQFFKANARVINALTIRDVVYGEIDDPVLEARDIEDLLAIEQIEFQVFTGTDLARQAMKLRRSIDSLRKEPDAWRDDDMLTEMVDLATVCGDIRNNDLVPNEVMFRHNTFWTSHFGGVYVFIDPDQTTVIGNPDAPGFRRSRPWQVSYIDARDGDLVYRFLVETGRVQMPRGRWIEESGLLDHRIRMLVSALAFHENENCNPQPWSQRWVNGWVKEHARLVEKEGTLPFLQWAQRQLESWSNIDMEEVDPRGRFILSRARPDHEDAWLVNRLIGDYVPFDYITRYVFNKPAFYEDYEEWNEDRREHIVKSVSQTYLNDKVGLRRETFGLED